MSISKKQRAQVYKKYNGHCGYCGKEIEIKEMQVDHMNPQCLKAYNLCLFDGVIVDKTHDIENLMPTCRRCNHYKRAATVEQFRHLMQTLHKRIESLYTNRVALDYGIIKIEPFNGKFYFETINKESLKICL